MAAFIRIRQNLIHSNGTVSRGPFVWSYVNTTLDDETTIIRDGLVPLGLLASQGELSVDEDSNLESIFKTFFAQGYFFTAAHWDNMQNMLKAHGYPEVELFDDGLYDQPQVANSKNAKPTTKAWRLNGKRRLREYDVVFDKMAEQQAREACEEMVAELATRDADISAEEARIMKRVTADISPSANTAATLQFL